MSQPDPIAVTQSNVGVVGADSEVGYKVVERDYPPPVPPSAEER